MNQLRMVNLSAYVTQSNLVILRKPVFIIASSGHAKVVIDIFEQGNDYRIAGIIDGNRTKGSEFLGYEVLGARDDLPELLASIPAELFVAIGDNWLRKRVVDEIRALVENPIFAKAIHPAAVLGRDVEVGEGVVIMAGATINVDSRIEDFAIVNTQAGIDHDCRIGIFASVAPGAILGGQVVVGRYSVIALGAKVKHRVHIGIHTVVGAGALVLRDCPDQRVVYGIPARDIRHRDIGESYL